MFNLKILCGHCGKICECLDLHARESEPCARKAAARIESFGPVIGPRVFGTDNLYQQALAFARANVAYHDGDYDALQDPRN